MLFQPDQESNKGRYKIIKNVGSGGFGIAYLAQDQKNARQVVIKTLNKGSITVGSVFADFITC